MESIAGAVNKLLLHAARPPKPASAPVRFRHVETCCAENTALPPVPHMLITMAPFTLRLHETV
jgi:hypothetical protein